MHAYFTIYCHRALNACRFAQTSYRSVFPKAQRKYNSSQLATCGQGHFTIRLRDFHNRSDGGPIVWGAVIGLKESFTFEELLSFPIFVLRNHGDTWNELAWTYWLILPLTVPLWWWERARARDWFGWKWLSPFDPEMAARPRAWLYDFAVVAFLAAGIEVFVHLFYAQATSEWGYQFWVGLFAVVLFSNGFPIMVTMFAWHGMYHPDWIIAQGWWAPIEMASAFSYLLLFGSGFFLGPALVFVAASVRLLDWLELDWAWVFTGRLATQSASYAAVGATGRSWPAFEKQALPARLQALAGPSRGLSQFPRRRARARPAGAGHPGRK